VNGVIPRRVARGAHDVFAGGWSIACSFHGIAVLLNDNGVFISEWKGKMATRVVSVTPLLNPILHRHRAFVFVARREASMLYRQTAAPRPLKP